jgi:hypothetical protein
MKKLLPLLGRLLLFGCRKQGAVHATACKGAGTRVRGGLALPSGKNHGMTTLRNTLAALEGCE